MKSRTLSRRGASCVEFALVAPVLLLFLFAIIQYGHLLMTRDLIDNAAREGARRAVVSVGAASNDDIKAVVQKALSGQGPNNLTVTVYRADAITGVNLGSFSQAQSGDCITVLVEGDYVAMFPAFNLVLPSTKMRAKVTMRSEN